MTYFRGPAMVKERVDAIMAPSRAEKIIEHVPRTSTARHLLE